MEWMENKTPWKTGMSVRARVIVYVGGGLAHLGLGGIIILVIDALLVIVTLSHQAEVK